MKNIQVLRCWIILFGIFFFCGVQATRARTMPPVAPSPVEFYRGVATAIEKAQGHVLLDMNGGKYKLTVNGKNFASM